MATPKTEKPAFERLGLEGIPEGLSPEEVEVLQKLQGHLVEFILHLIQSFLRTGYYTPDHPESKKFREGLYEEFKGLFKMEEELTFIVREEQEGPSIFVEGVLPEPQRLGRMMMRGMGDLYVPKFAKYLERKDLVSLTLKNKMGEGEFGRFIDIMSDPSQVDIRQKEEKDRFAKTIYDAGIFNISFVFNEELVIAADREIPWRARLTLSRMKKDMKMIPFFEKLTGDQIHDIGKNLIRDTIRPVRQPDLLYAVLRNADIAASAVNPEEEIESVVISFLQPKPLVGASRLFLREHLSLKELQKKDHFEARSDRQLKKISGRLKEIGAKDKDAEGLLEEYFHHQLIGLDDLTPALKDKIILGRLTDKFLKYTQGFFEQLNQAKEQETFLTLAQSFLKMIPELIRRDRYVEIHRILETLRIHFHQKKTWGLLAGHVLEEIGTGPAPSMLEEKFLAGKKEARASMIPIFVALEIGAIPSLLNILRKSEDQWVRKNACEVLIQIGPVAAVHLLKELEGQKISVETTCDILRVLGEIKSQEWRSPLLKLLKRYVSHESPRLREQALHTLCAIGGKEGEENFIAALVDGDLDVQKRAVWCLGIIKSPKGAEKIVGMLGKMAATPGATVEPLETQIYHALGFSGNLTVGGKTVEQILLEVLEKRGMKQWWGLFEKHQLAESSMVTICETLGKIGTKESVNLLQKLAKSREGSWVLKAQEALKKIEERSGSAAP
jgi:HEAT repeat protein